MTSIGTGYDYSCTTFSPDGRVFQVEYADKAVESAPTAIGFRCVDGVVLAVENLISSKMLEPSSNRRIHSLDKKIGCVHSGLIPDARQLIARGRSEARQFREQYGGDILVNHLANRLTHYVHAHTLYSSIRPFGCSLIVGGFDKSGAHLHLIEPQGISYEYKATAVGKGAAAAKTELEKLNFERLTVEDALLEAARIIHMVHDSTKDKEFRLELSYVSASTNYQHTRVSPERVLQLQASAQQALDALDDDEDL